MHFHLWIVLSRDINRYSKRSERDFLKIIYYVEKPSYRKNIVSLEQDLYFKKEIREKANERFILNIEAQGVLVKLDKEYIWRHEKAL